MGGPIWSAPIHDQEWVSSILANVKASKERYPAYERISAVLTTISEVLSLPLYVLYHQFIVCCMYHLKLVNENYWVAYSSDISKMHICGLIMLSDYDIMICRSFPMSRFLSVCITYVPLSNVPRLLQLYLDLL